MSRTKGTPYFAFNYKFKNIFFPVLEQRDSSLTAVIRVDPAAIDDKTLGLQGRLLKFSDSLQECLELFRRDARTLARKELFAQVDADRLCDALESRAAQLLLPAVAASLDGLIAKEGEKEGAIPEPNNNIWLLHAQEGPLAERGYFSQHKDQVRPWLERLRENVRCLPEDILALRYRFLQSTMLDANPGQGSASNDTRASIDITAGMRLRLDTATVYTDDYGRIRRYMPSGSAYVSFVSLQGALGLSPDPTAQQLARLGEEVAYGQDAADRDFDKTKIPDLDVFGGLVSFKWFATTQDLSKSTYRRARYRLFFSKVELSGNGADDNSPDKLDPIILDPERFPVLLAAETWTSMQEGTALLLNRKPYIELPPSPALPAIAFFPRGRTQLTPEVPVVLQRVLQFVPVGTRLSQVIRSGVGGTDLKRIRFFRLFRSTRVSFRLATQQDLEDTLLLAGDEVSW